MVPYHSAPMLMSERELLLPGGRGGRSPKEVCGGGGGCYLDRPLGQTFPLDRGGRGQSRSQKYVALKRNVPLETI